MKKAKKFKRNYVERLIKKMTFQQEIYYMDVSNFKRPYDIENPVAVPWGSGNQISGVCIQHPVFDNILGFVTEIPEYVKLRYPVELPWKEE